MESGIESLQTGNNIFSTIFGAIQLIFPRLSRFTRFQDLAQGNGVGIGLMKGLISGVGDAARIRDSFHFVFLQLIGLCLITLIVYYTIKSL